MLAHDAKADGRFVYAVKSTGVFCRPSCPSRRPKRENVEFFDSPTQAQQQGYRPCQRCTPLERNPQTQKVEAACRYIDQNLDITLSLTAISRHVAISPFHFQRLFKRILGISPREYQQARRAGKFRQALLGEGSVTEAIYEAGYSSSSRAYESIPAQLGMTPSAFRRGGEGIEIRCTVVSTELGKLLVATTARGVCAVRFGESDAALLRELKHDFKAAEIRRDDAGLEPVATQIKGNAEGIDRTVEYSARSARHRVSANGVERAATHSVRARRGATRNWRRRSAGRKRCAPWRMPAARTLSPWWCRAIAWCRKTGAWLDIGGA